MIKLSMEIKCKLRVKMENNSVDIMWKKYLKSIGENEEDIIYVVVFWRR